MKKPKIVVVDDSPFSIMVLTDMLNKSGFEVAGDAKSLEEVKEKVERLRPDIVTMDMTIPGTDGLECTRAVHAIDPNIKVIIISSMMDDEIVRAARKNKISGYIQKPVDPDELSLLINRIMSDDELYHELELLYFNVFREAFLDAFNKFFKIVPEFQSEETTNTEQISRGISVVMGIIGKYSGRLIFDISYETGEKLLEAVLKTKPQSREEVFNFMSELVNIAAGNACSIINRRNQLFGLRVAPPTILHGSKIIISKAELGTIKFSIANTEFGEFCLNVGFAKEETEWMSNM